MNYATLPGREHGHRDDPRAFDRPHVPEVPFRLTVGHTDVPAWVQPVAHQLRELHGLGVNWTGYRAMPVQSRLIETAFSEVLANVMPSEGAVPRIVPCVDGGIQLEWHRGGWDVEVNLDPMGEIWVDAARADGTDAWDGDFAARQDDLKQLLQTIA